MRSYTAKIVPASGGAPVEVTVEANNRTHAKHMVVAQHSPKRILFVTDN